MIKEIRPAIPRALRDKASLPKKTISENVKIIILALRTDGLNGMAVVYVSKRADESI